MHIGKVKGAVRFYQIKVNINKSDGVFRILLGNVLMPRAQPDDGIFMQRRFAVDHIHYTFSGIENPEIIIFYERARLPGPGTGNTPFPQRIAANFEMNIQMIPVQPHELIFLLP